MNLENKLSRKEINYLDRKCKIIRSNWISYGGILILGLSILCVLTIILRDSYHVINLFNIGPFTVNSFDIGLFYFCPLFALWLFLAFDVMLFKKTMSTINGFQTANAGSIILGNKGHIYLRVLSLWLDRKSWRFWILTIALLSLSEIGREIYVDWKLKSAGLMFAIFLSPVLSTPLLIMDYTKIRKIIEKIQGAPIQPGTGRE